MGISTADLPHIFEEFYRAEEAGNRDSEGTGLGLSIVESAIEAHEGRCEVESEPGEGTTFRIVLPRGDTEMAGGQEGHEETPCGGRK